MTKSTPKPTINTKANKRKLILYVISVSFFSILFMIFANQSWFQPISIAILEGYSRISSAVLNIFQQGTTVSGANISSIDFSIAVKKGCDALAPMILYIFSIVFFPANKKAKIKGLLIGLPVLAVLNVIRIISLFLVGKYGNQMLFDIFHVDIWQIVFIVLTLVLWSLWLRSIQDKRIVDV